MTQLLFIDNDTAERLLNDENVTPEPVQTESPEVSSGTQNSVKKSTNSKCDWIDYKIVVACLLIFIKHVTWKGRSGVKEKGVCFEGGCLAMYMLCIFTQNLMLCLGELNCFFLFCHDNGLSVML